MDEKEGLQTNRQVLPQGIVGLFRIAIASAVAAYFVGGFVAGIMHCEGCDNVLGALLVGVVWTFLSAIGLGTVPLDGTGLREVSTWPYIFGSWPVLFAIVGIWKILPRNLTSELNDHDADSDSTHT